MESLLHSLVSLRWQDSLDILINSYILFRLYILFRGTNVIRMLFVIVMLWLLKLLSTNIGMIVTSWLIQGIIAAAALIIIIVFRNEIAAVFKVPSLRSFFWGIPQRQIHTPIDIIAESVEELADRKLGALIVLPLKKGLQDAVHGGILWQGTLSQEMILSIFWHGTPVHDGAIIIQGDQILKVGAILPLSKKSDLPPHFGTRHRAAAGLTEQTDALVIVVSEERGEITVFKDQSIINIDTTNELHQVLQKYAGTVTDKKEDKKQLREIYTAAMLCLIFVTGIWLSFARGLETFMTLEVPIEFMNRDPHMKIYSASVGSVKLQISGSRSLITTVTPDQLKVKLNLGNASLGNNQVPIISEGIVLPPGIDFKQVEPQSITVNMDVPGEKELAVQPSWTGKLPAKFIMQNSSVSPDTVTVVGGSLSLENIRTIYTEAIPLNNITADGKVTVGLMPLPSPLQLSDESQTSVEVIYKVIPRPHASNSTNK